MKIESRVQELLNAPPARPSEGAKAIEQHVLAARERARARVRASRARGKVGAEPGQVLHTRPSS